jgi:hypothetical protein
MVTSLFSLAAQSEQPGAHPLFGLGRDKSAFGFALIYLRQQERIAFRFVSKAKATLHSPFLALKRSSFMFEYLEPFSVSTR